MRIGRNVVIEPFVVIHENVAIGDNSIIHSNVVIGGRSFSFARANSGIMEGLSDQGWQSLEILLKYIHLHKLQKEFGRTMLHLSVIILKLMLIATLPMVLKWGKAP